MKKYTLIIIVTLIIVIAAGPWGLYAFGLLNISGRPVPPLNIITQDIHLEMKKIHFQRMCPWSYFHFFISKDISSYEIPKELWIVAKNYNYNHLKDKRVLFWHLSDSALIIWLSRNWTTEQILSKAIEIKERQNTTLDKPLATARLD